MIDRLKKSEFVRNSFWSFLAVSFRSFGSVLISKLFSVFFGASGLAILSHFQNLMGFFTSFANEGVNKSVIKYWTDKKLKRHEKKSLFKTALWVTASIILILLLPLVWWFRAYFFNVFFSVGFDKYFVILFVFGVLLLAFAWCINSLILVEGSVKEYAVINILGLISLLLVVFFGVKTCELSRALSFFVIGNGVMFFFSFFYLLYRKKELLKSFIGWPELLPFRRISRFLIMAISVVAFGQALDFVVRDYIIDSYGLDRTGEWQAVVKMSSNYQLLLTNVIGAVYYPKVSKLIYNQEKLRRYVLKVLAIMSVTSLLCLSIYYFNRSSFLRVFFDQGLEGAAYLVKYQAIGDFFALNSFLLAAILFANVRTKSFVVGRLISAFIFILTVALLLESIDLEALTMGYMLRQIGLFIVLVFFNRGLLFSLRSNSSHQESAP